LSRRDIPLLIRSEQVKTTFGDPTTYLKRQYRLRWRRDAVEAFIGSESPRRVVDLGCGDGSLSRPVLERCERLTLVDSSAAMLESARRDTPAAWLPKVDFLNSDANELDLLDGSFDLAMCIGLLAHVDDSDAMIERVARLVRPGGMLILEHTDVEHPIGWLLVQYSRVRSRLKPARYAWNALSSAHILQRCGELGLTLHSQYRFGLPFRLDRILEDQAMYRLGRHLFGDPKHNRNGWLGCERMYCFKRG
jgi:ubiquinone/menaquinone biosynthesis C-methylase UbiE